MLGWGRNGRGWIGTTKNGEAEYNARIAGTVGKAFLGVPVVPAGSTRIYLQSDKGEPGYPKLHWDAGNGNMSDWNNLPMMTPLSGDGNWYYADVPRTGAFGVVVRYKPNEQVPAAGQGTIPIPGSASAYRITDASKKEVSVDPDESLYSVSDGSKVQSPVENPLKQVTQNIKVKDSETVRTQISDYSNYGTTISNLSVMLSKVTDENTAIRASSVTDSVTRRKYNSVEGAKTGQSDIGVFINGVNEKKIVFDAGVDNPNSTVVFQLDGSQLNDARYTGIAFSFKNVQGKSVVVNVSGQDPISFHNGWNFYWEGEEIGDGYWEGSKNKKAYEDAAQAILWNFYETSKLTIHGGQIQGSGSHRWAYAIDGNGKRHGTEHEQDIEVSGVTDDPAAAMLGSILVPKGSFEDHVTTNGRVWVGQDFMMYNPSVAANFPSGVSEGDSASVIDMDQERHNFPWGGSIRSDCSAIGWSKSDEQDNRLSGSTWGVYKTLDGAAQKNDADKLLTAADGGSVDRDPNDGGIRVESLAPNATYYLRELIAPTNYKAGDYVFAIKTTTMGTETNTAITNVWSIGANNAITEIQELSKWPVHSIGALGDDGNPIANVTVDAIENHPAGTPVSWGKYEQGKPRAGLPGSEWRLTRIGEPVWTEVIADNTEAVTGVDLYQGSTKVTNRELQITEGGTLRLTAQVTPNTATQEVTWTSSDPAVVVQDGQIVANGVPANETATITATTVDKDKDGNQLSASVTIHVTAVQLESLTLQYQSSPAPQVIYATVGDTRTLQATVAPSELINSITWASSNPLVATVDNGVVTAMTAGRTTITVKCQDDQSKWKSVTIDVSEPPVNATTIYVKWENAAPYIHWWEASGYSESINGDAAMAVVSNCNGTWYRYRFDDYTGKSIKFNLTQYSDKSKSFYGINKAIGDDVGASIETGKNYNISIDGRWKNYIIDNGGITGSESGPNACLASGQNTSGRSAPQRAAGGTSIPENAKGTHADSNSAVGQFTIGNLPAGTYTLKEETAPRGYTLNTNTYQFTISDSGAVTWSGDSRPDDIDGDHVDADGQKRPMGWIADKPTSVVWNKVDGHDGSPLSGSGWTVEVQDGTVWKQVAVVADCASSPCAATGLYYDENPVGGGFEIKRLPVGQYRMFESTTPSGYEDGRSVYWYFTINTSGTAQVSREMGSSDAGVATRSAGEVSSIPNTRILGSVSWLKVSSDEIDAERPTPLTGSEWKLERLLTAATETQDAQWEDVHAVIADCATTEVEGAAVCVAGSIDQNPASGDFLVKNLQWGKYRLVETKAPDGYNLDATAREFEITRANAGTTFAVGRIGNTPGVVLPVTGGEGDTWMLVVGVALIAISMLGCAVAVHRRAE